MTTVQVSEDGPVATLLLNRPERYNAMSAEMSRDMASALDQLEQSSAHVVVVRGAGSAFSAGADLHSLADEIDLDDPRGIADYVVAWSRNILRLRALALPSIAALHGPAYGGGFSLAMACDIAIAERHARLNTQYINIGINTDLGLSWTLPRIVSPALSALSGAAGPRDQW